MVLMGQKPSAYSARNNNPEELLRIYRANYPKLEDADAVQDVIEFARSKGLENDPKALVQCGNIGVRENTGLIGNGCVGERGVCKNRFSGTQKRI